MRILQRLGDGAAYRQGDWVEGLAGFDGFRVRLRPLDCDAALAFQDRLTAEVVGRKRMLRLAALPPEIVAYRNARALIDVCVSDWGGLMVPVDAAGAPTLDPDRVASEKDLPYSRELLAFLLLEEAADGKIVTDPAPGEPARAFRTPDGMQARVALRDFRDALVAASLVVGRDAEAGGDDDLKNG